MQRERNSVVTALIAAFGLVLAPGVAPAGTSAGFQLGYVYNAWSSNFIVDGAEHRVPASFRLAADDFSLSLEGAFVSGEYRQDATASTSATDFSAGELSDTQLSFSVMFPLGEGLRSSLAGGVNIPTGDPAWEGRSESGSIPLIFEPAYYRGRGWGGNLFYSVASPGETFQWSLSAGYLFTSTYDVGLDADNLFNPGDSLVVMGGMGGPLSGDERVEARLVHAFPFESKVEDPATKFTSGESTVCMGRWVRTMGRDALSLNVSYSFYSRGMVVDPLTLEPVREEQNFLGDRLELQPHLAFEAGPGVELATGLVWNRIFPNGYPEADEEHYEGGGNLFGVEQGVTFEMGSGAFLNVAGLYHYILHEKAALDSGGALTNIEYHRFAAGTNVGFQW